MHKGVAALWHFFSSAPVMVSIGMTTLILGGVSGSQFLDSGTSHTLWPQFGLSAPHLHPKKALTKPLQQEIESLKRQSASDAVRLAEAGTDNLHVNFLSYAQNEESLEIRRDPFAPLPPPKQPAKPEKGKLNVQVVQQKANVVVPGDSANRARRVHRRGSRSHGAVASISANIPKGMIPAAMAALLPQSAHTANQTAVDLTPKQQENETIQ